MTNTTSHATFFSNLIPSEEDENISSDQIKEADELEKAVSNLIDLSQVHSASFDEKELIIHDFTFEVGKFIVDKETGLLTPFGQKFLDDFNGVTQDVNCLFSYLSPYSRSTIKQVNDSETNPFVFFKFLSELYDYQSSLTSIIGINPQVYSDFVVNVLVRSPQLFNKTNNEAIIEEVKSILDSVVSDDADRESITSIVEECFCSALNSSYTQVPKDPAQKMFDTFSISDSDISNLRETQGLQTNFIMLNTYSHYVASMRNDIYKKLELPDDMMNEVDDRMTLFSNKIGEIIALQEKSNKQRKPAGNVSLKFHVDWEPKFQNSRLSKSSYIEVLYNDFKTLLPPEHNKNYTAFDSEIVVPFFDKDDTVTVRLMYVIEKFDGTPISQAKPEQTNVLTEVKIQNLNQDNTVQNKFKKTSSIVPTSCGKISVNVKYSKDKMVQVKSTNILSEAIGDKVADIIEVIVSKLNKDWLTDQRTVPLSPPITDYLILIELCVRYSYPAAFVFINLLENFSSVWCESESYIAALLVLYLITKNAVFLCSSTEQQKEKFKEIESNLCGKVSSALKLRFILPWKHEKCALKELIIFFSFLQETFQEEEKKDMLILLHGMMKDTKGLVLKRIFKYMKPEKTEKRAKEELIDIVQYMKNNAPALTFEECDSGCFTFPITSLAACAEHILSTIKIMRKFYDQNVVPLQFKVSTEIDDIFIQMSGKLIHTFIATDPDPGDTNLFKFYFAYKELWEIYKLGKELSPFKLFFNVLIQWLCVITDKLSTWTKRAVDRDTFEIDDKKRMTSTSLADIMTIFTQSFTFVQKLNWRDRNIVDIVETYLATCTSCVKYYTELLTMIIFTYFPKDIILNNCESSVYYGIINQTDLVYNQNTKLTPEQIYVIINDFTSIKESWSDFLLNVSPLLGAQKLPEQFQDPVPDIDKITKAIPNLFAGLIEKEVHHYISSRLWVDNSGIKTLFLKKASKKIIHPDFTSHSSQFFNDLFESSINFISEKATALKNNIKTDKLMQMLEAFVRGLDAGLMNTLINQEEPIKHKRIEIIVEFIKEIQNIMYEKMRDEHDVMSQTYLTWAWKSKLIIDNIKLTPKEVMAICQNEKGQRGLIFFILARSYTNDPKCVQWAHKHEQEFLYSTFNPQD